MRIPGIGGIDTHVNSGMTTHQFAFAAHGRSVPAILWARAGSSGRRPLLLIGHGGSQHKSHPAIAALARCFVIPHDYVVAAIDGPIHGQRRAGDTPCAAQMQREFISMWQADTRIDSMIADWRALIDLLAAAAEINCDAIGWLGLSMGTAYGLPLLACERRIGVAVLGMWGTSFVNSERLAQDAQHVRCPVLFQQKWHDEYYTREGQIELFDRLGSTDKQLNVYMGSHTVPSGRQLADLVDYLTRHLSASRLCDSTM